MKLQKDYFLNKDVLHIAEDLLGKYLFTKIDGQLAGGVITETEAYRGTTDKASHAYGGRRTHRNETMYAQGGVIYVYLCYGMHHLLNIVTNEADVPDAVLLRAIFPTHGGELMLQRCGKNRVSAEIGTGPGKVSKILGITTADDGSAIPSSKIWIEDRNFPVLSENILKTARIGVDYAAEDATLPYRFVLQNVEKMILHQKI